MSVAPCADDPNPVLANITPNFMGARRSTQAAVRRCQPPTAAKHVAAVGRHDAPGAGSAEVGADDEQVGVGVGVDELAAGALGRARRRCRSASTTPGAATCTAWCMKSPVISGRARRRDSSSTLQWPGRVTGRRAAARRPAPSRRRRRRGRRARRRRRAGSSRRARAADGTAPATSGGTPGRRTGSGSSGNVGRHSPSTSDVFQPTWSTCRCVHTTASTRERVEAGVAEAVEERQLQVVPRRHVARLVVADARVDDDGPPADLDDERLDARQQHPVVVDERAASPAVARRARRRASPRGRGTARVPGRRPR